MFCQFGPFDQFGHFGQFIQIGQFGKLSNFGQLGQFFQFGQFHQFDKVDKWRLPGVRFRNPLMVNMTVQLHYTNSHWLTQSTNESWFSEAVLSWIALEFL